MSSRSYLLLTLLRDESYLANRSLSLPWTGFTQFSLIKPPSERKGYKFVDGRETRIKASSNPPDHIRPETWERFGKEAKQKEIDAWPEIKRRRDEA